MTIVPVRPAAPVAPWLGGKRQLSARIIERTRNIPHKAYIEPFVGMGGVFLRRDFRPKLEVANDLNGEIVNLFRILQRHHNLLLQLMRFQLVSRRDFERLRETDPATLTDLERAARFLYLQRLSFGGQVGGVFGVASERSSRFSLSRIEPILEAAHERLESVVFECLPWRDVVERYDSEATLFYLDPPYIGGEKDYGKDMFQPAEFSEMAEVLSSIEGKFILSINDHPLARELFGNFDLEEVKVTYSVSAEGPNKNAGELLITNHAPIDLLSRVEGC